MMSLPASMRIWSRLTRFTETSLRLLCAFLTVQAMGCAFPWTQRASSPDKPAQSDTRQPSGSVAVPPAGGASPAPSEQPDKTQPAEKKASGLKEKKPAATVGKTPKKKSSPPEEASSEAPAPPVPLKPPTFGGAGG